MELAPASWDLVPEILQILKTNFPDSMNTYNKLNGQYYFLKTYNKPAATLLTPDGKLDKYGTFLFFTTCNQFDLQMDTLNPDLESFAKAIASCQLIDWTKSPILGSTHVRLYPLLDHLQKILPNNFRMDFPANSFYMSREKALNVPIKVPDDIELKRLTLDHAETVNNLWPHGKSERSLITVHNLITKRPNVGLFKKDSNELVAWCLYGEYGGPAVLQVKEEYKRKGYGEIALSFMTVRSAEMGLDPQAYILPNNEPCKNLFRKLGYEEKHQAAWVLFRHKPAKRE